jgi:predicted component of type VI protein secretion system
MIGRAPEDDSGIAVGPYLDDGGVRWVSRNHAKLELADDVLTITDSSTNGTTIITRTGPNSPTKTVTLSSGESHELGEWDTIRLYQGVEIGRADRLPGRAPAAAPESVMVDAPTMALRLPSA